MLCQDIPSPTTGTFPIHSIKDENSLLNPIMLEDGSSYGSEDSYYRFTPRGELRLGNQVIDANISFIRYNFVECVNEKALLLE